MADIYNPPIGGSGSGSVTSVSVTTQNGVSATVTNPTTTPALAFALGAITPTSVVASGDVSSSGGNIHVNLGNIFYFVSGSTIRCATDGNITLTNNANSSFGLLQLGGTTSSFPAIKRSSAALAFRVADDSADATVTFATQSAGDNTNNGATTQFVTTAVNNAISGVNPAVAVQVATTLASDTSGLTYNNGASGIGATFTGSNNTALAFDGVTLTSVNQRVLVKNDTQSPSGAFNGIYFLTQLQTAILPPILTRALDYDQPSDINNTGAIPVILGTANAGTSWVQTAQIVTVGTSPLAFTQFTLNPTTLVTLTGTQTLTNKRVTKRVITTTQSATPTINTDNTDVSSITALAQAITSFTTNLSGTPVAGDLLMIQITDNGTARAITWGASFEATTVALPSTTVISTMLRVGFQWNTVASKWDCIAVA